MTYYGKQAEITNLIDNRFVKFKFFDLVELAGIETIVTFLYFEYKGKLYQSLGAASRFSKEEAIVKATLEAWQGVEYALSLESKVVLPDIVDLGLINDFDKHFHFYNKYLHLRSECPILKQATSWDSGNDNIYMQDENAYQNHLLNLDLQYPEMIIYICRMKIRSEEHTSELQSPS